MRIQSNENALDAVVEIRRPEEFDWIELHSGSEVTAEYPRHWHDDFYLCAILGGTGYLECPGRNFMTPRGALVVVPSGVVHTNRKFACTFRCVFMEFKALQNTAERFLEQAIGGLNFRAVVLEDSEFMKDFLQLHRAMKKGGPVLGRESALLSFLHTLAARHSTATVRVPRDGNEGFAVKRSKQYLEEHYAERVLLQDLARLTGLSPYHLNRSFCRIIGMPPHAYQLQVRLARARWLLRRGQSIIETALLAGFADQSHFTRHFKRAVGVTPGEYLR